MMKFSGDGDIIGDGDRSFSQWWRGQVIQLVQKVVMGTGQMDR
jgi:hypothetical protein